MSTIRPGGPASARRVRGRMRQSSWISRLRDFATGCAPRHPRRAAQRRQRPRHGHHGAGPSPGPAPDGAALRARSAGLPSASSRRCWRAYLIQVGWIRLVGGLYLLYLTYSHFTSREDGEETAGRHPPPSRGWGSSPFWATVVRVELINLAFSIDSILVAVAMSPKLWVVVVGGILGIVAMRLVVGQLLTLVQRYPALVDGAFIIIAWVGAEALSRSTCTRPATCRSRFRSGSRSASSS